MARKKTLVKTLLREEYLKNEVNERVCYLSIPEDYTKYSIREDIKNGGVQFEQLLALTEKKRITRTVVLAADSYEMGMMAVSYLAMHLLKKQEVAQEEAVPFGCSGVEGAWEEDAMKIPVISILEMIRYMRRNTGFPVEDGGFLMAQSAPVMIHKPYWCSCTKEPVCIVAKRADVERDCMKYVSIFHENRNVFVLFLSNDGAEQEMDGMPFLCFDEQHFQALKNNFILSNAADAVEVSFLEKNTGEYYGNVFRQNVRQRGLRVGRNFSSARVVNLAKSVNENAVCEMIDKIISYAIKDMDNSEQIVLQNQSFDFADVFLREKTLQTDRETGAKRMERELVGIEEIKQQVYDVVNVMKYNKMRREMKIFGSEFHNVHLMIGPPGTAKTTVAKYMGQMMFDERLLSDNRIICINGAELKGRYVGHSAPRTKALFENYDVIIVDEAYSIVEADGTTDSFGNEVIAQLIIELENHSMDKLVIFAGYGGEVDAKDNKMQLFLDANPGIKSRITSTFYFQPYSAAQMAEIFQRIAKNRQFTLESGCKEAAEAFFQMRVNQKNFGNGREARALLETAVVFAAKRTMNVRKKQYTAAEMQTLTLSDVKNAMEKMQHHFGNWKKEKHQIGF